RQRQVLCEQVKPHRATEPDSAGSVELPGRGKVRLLRKALPDQPADPSPGEEGGEDNSAAGGPPLRGEDVRNASLSEEVSPGAGVETTSHSGSSHYGSNNNHNNNSNNSNNNQNNNNNNNNNNNGRGKGRRGRAPGDEEPTCSAPDVDAGPKQLSHRKVVLAASGAASDEEEYNANGSHPSNQSHPKRSNKMEPLQP
ncbi:unnamed protein product, partial [Polarella glacialis]